MRAAFLLAFAIVGFGAAMPRPSATRRFAHLQDACAMGTSAQSCERVGVALARGEPAPRFPEEPGLYFAKACGEGRASACKLAMPWVKPYGDYEIFELDASCMIDSNAFACEEVATSLRDETNEANEAPSSLPIARSRMKRALDLHLTACAHDQADACMGASRVYAAAFGVEWNLRESHAYEAKACTLGLADACEAAGDHDKGSAAVALYQRACAVATSSPHACLKLARAEAAAGSPRSVIDASYRRACGELAFDACRELSHSIDRLDGEPPAIVAAFSRWCATGEPGACELVTPRSR